MAENPCLLENKQPVSLNELKEGQKGFITSIEDNQQTLAGFGILPHSLISMKANYHAYFIFRINNKTIATDRMVAGGIFVKPI